PVGEGAGPAGGGLVPAGSAQVLCEVPGGSRCVDVPAGGARFAGRRRARERGVAGPVAPGEGDPVTGGEGKAASGGGSRAPARTSSFRTVVMGGTP
ncbi:hypothetical protein, partial [Streptomyces kasugaensis]|uniref:hypothetical protein n=1 Tax=Streptomyces kasugaensis TaxID=1946 RepID=UPI001A9527D1